jgi:outer membrane protein
MSIGETLRRQWRSYGRYHRTRTNLPLHLFAVPLRWLSSLTTLSAIIRFNLQLLAIAVVGVMISLIIQGRDHARGINPHERFIRAGYALWLLAAVFASSAMAQDRSLQTVLDDYVNDALNSNLELAQQDAQVDQVRAILQQARAHYLPELSLSARYTVNDGGRTLSFPVGDLLNPVYSTLNDMLVAQGGSAQFSTVQNQEIPLLRPHEQDTHLSLRQPIYAPAVAAGVTAQQGMVNSVEQQRLALRRELKRDVTVAYLSWLQAHAAVDIVQSSRTLLMENVRINQSLFDNGKVTEDQPLRAKAELLAIEQQLQTAQQQQAAAQRYVNFLRNHPLNEPLQGSETDVSNLPAMDSNQLREQAKDRAELKQVDESVSAASAQVDLARAESRPSLPLGIDAGIQGDKYGFGPDYNYVSGSLLLNWKFYAGGGLRAQVDAAKAQQRRLQRQRDELAAQIDLQVQQALDSYETARASLNTAEARVAAADAAFRIAGRKRDEGVINQAEYLDARNALTTAELNLNVTRFAVHIERANLEFAAADQSIR